MNDKETPAQAGATRGEDAGATSEYDAAVTVRTTDVPGRYAGRFSDLWRIGNAVNGGW